MKFLQQKLWKDCIDCFIQTSEKKKIEMLLFTGNSFYSNHLKWKIVCLDCLEISKESDAKWNFSAKALIYRSLRFVEWSKQPGKSLYNGNRPLK